MMFTDQHHFLLKIKFLILGKGKLFVVYIFLEKGIKNINLS